MPLTTPSVQLWLGLVLLFLALVWLSRQISLQIQLLVYCLTRSEERATLALFLIFLPGILLHEAAHWVTARLLGLKAGKFRVWPKRQGQQIGLGSVSVQSGGALADSLVGIAPLVVGSLAVALISHLIFDAARLGTALAQGDWPATAQAFTASLDQPDGLLWAYLLFAVANAMIPSNSDREPLKPVLLYAALAAGMYIFLQLPLPSLPQLMAWLGPPLQSLSSAFLFVTLLDLLILVCLSLALLALGRQPL